MDIVLPSTSNELNDRSKHEKCAVKCQTHVPPVFSQQPIKNFKPLQTNQFMIEE